MWCSRATRSRRYGAGCRRGSVLPGEETNSVEWVLSTVRPRESGDPLFATAILTPGPRFRGGERRKTYSIVKQPSFVGPSFGRAWGLPVSFSLPPTRGVARREGAWPGFRQTGPVFHGRARNAGTLTHMPRASASSRRATRHLRLYAFNGSVGPAGSLWAAGGLPAAARGRGSRLPRSRVPHPAPPSRRLATTPLDGRDGSTLDRNIIAVKRKSPEVNNTVHPAHVKVPQPYLHLQY